MRFGIVSKEGESSPFFYLGDGRFGLGDGKFVEGLS